MKWQSILTAPMQGERILLLVPPYGATTGHYYKDWHCHSVLNKEAVPTHWMPLPAPPKEDADEDTKKD
jgi:hypothetical protein|tara:strand:- start:339 stop:542 length:204 start_codon:yes stop_codon:yes gene_type:complete